MAYAALPCLLRPPDSSESGVHKTTILFLYYPDGQHKYHHQRGYPQNVGRDPADEIKMVQYVTEIIS